jgi:hypothetical protein
MSYAALAALANDYLEPTPSAEDIPGRELQRDQRELS